MASSNKFEFENQAGQILAGRLELPDGNPRTAAIFAHCFTCSKNVKAASRISRALAERGIAVLRFDFTGLGNSEGDFSNTNFSSNVADLIAAASALSRDFQAPQILVGHSLGGTAALLAAGRIDSIRAVATIGSPAEPAHVKHLFGDKLSDIHERGAWEVELGGRRFTIRKQFLDDLEAATHRDEIGRIGVAVMIYHSPQDELVSINEAQAIYKRLRHPKNFISIDGADHLLTSEADAGFVAETLAAWSARYIRSDRQ